MDREGSIIGCLMGAAIGDALGLPYEGLSRQRAARLLGPPDRYRLIGNRGMVSDDTEHLCLVAQALEQVALGAAQEVVAAWFPRLDSLAGTLFTSSFVPAAVIYMALYVLFFTLTPTAYRAHPYPKWPGALLVTGWWVAVSVALPGVLRRFFTYDLTYGSLAGVMISLFFFWLVGLGMVIGAELNAALDKGRQGAGVVLGLAAGFFHFA